MIKKILICLAIGLILCGCNTVSEIDKPLAPIVFEKEEPYALDTSKLIESDPPSMMLMIQDSSGNIRPTREGETATYVVMSYDDSKKIAALVDIKNGYKNVSKEQAALINIERNKLASIKEMMEIERQNRQNERQLRVDVEKAYKDERKDHKWDNIVNRGSMVFMIIGGVAIAAM